MGNINAVPVVSQIKSAVQAIGGDLEGAGRTQEEFSKQCPVVSQVRSAVEASLGDPDAALRTQIEFMENLEYVADATPILGHVKGVVHHALGDTEKGGRCITSATQTTSVVAAGMEMGMPGLLVGGAMVRRAD